MLIRLKRISVEPFIGYTEFGGKSKKDENDYEDQYWFRALEIGSNCYYRFPAVDIGLGAKYNAYLKSYGKYFGGYGAEIDNTEAKWTETDWTKEFPRYSFDIGFSNPFMQFRKCDI